MADELELDRIGGSQRDLHIRQRSEQKGAECAGRMRAESGNLAAVVDGCRNFQRPAQVRIDYSIQISHDTAAVNKGVVSEPHETNYFSESVDCVSAASQASKTVQVCHRAPTVKKRMFHVGAGECATDDLPGIVNAVGKTLRAAQCAQVGHGSRAIQ